MHGVSVDKHVGEQIPDRKGFPPYRRQRKPTAERNTKKNFDEIDGVMYICDYKPDHGYEADATAWRKHFLSAIPQLCAYGLISKEIFNIDKLYCLSFNKDAEWIYDASQVLNQVNSHLRENGYTNYEMWEGLLP